jgi:hypothetical protein
MQPKIFHGDITPRYFARALIANFNRGNLRAQQFGRGDNVIVQVATHKLKRSGGDTAVSVTLEKVSDGVAVQIGQQSWMGVAASLGMSLLYTWRSPWNLLHRIDDIAQDIDHFQLTDQIWEVIEQAADTAGASFELSERLKRLECEYCQAANPVGESNCLACGAPLGGVQPDTCPVCGFVITANERICPNCRAKL